MKHVFPKIFVALGIVASILFVALLSHQLFASNANVPIPPSPNNAPLKPVTVLTKSENSINNINVKKLMTIAANDGLNPRVLRAALNSYAWARENGKVGNNTQTLTVVDFTLPSYVKRMWVLDLQNDSVLMKLYTTHGKGSGEVYATRFSNQPHSNTSSLGVYVTSEEYYGGHNKAMRLDGLESGVNNNARTRDIVIHEAAYATPEYIQSHHLAGRSWGCLAVAPAVKDELLNYVKGGSVVFTYAAAEDQDPIVKNGPVTII